MGVRESNRAVYIVLASGRYASFGNGRWRGVSRNAFLTEAAAQAEVPAFIERCKVPTHRLRELDGGSLSASVARFELVDDLPDENPSSVFLLQASGRSAVFPKAFSAISKTLYTRRETAATAVADFVRSCADPSFLDYAEGETLEVIVTELALVPEPEHLPRP